MSRWNTRVRPRFPGDFSEQPASARFEGMFAWLFQTFVEALVWTFTSKSGCLFTLAAIPFLIAVGIVQNVTGISQNLAYLAVVFYGGLAIFIGVVAWWAWKNPKEVVLSTLLFVVVLLVVISCSEAAIGAERFK